jgi:hypothetical protein
MVCWGFSFLSKMCTNHKWKGGRNDLIYVGLDVHKNVCYGTVMDEKGKVAKQTKFTNDPEGVEAFMEGIDEAQVAMEAVYYCARES